MNKKTFYRLLGLIPALGLMGRTVYRIQQREAKEAEYARTVAFQKSELAKNEAERDSSSKTNLGATLKKIGTDSAKDKYDTYSPVNDSYGLGLLQGKYYLYTTIGGQDVLLEGVDLAFVLPIDDQDEGSQFMALFVRKNAEWSVLNGEGEIELTLGAVEITEQTHFIIKDQTLTIAP